MIQLSGGVKSFTVTWTPSTEVDVVGYAVAYAHQDELINGDFAPANYIKNIGPETSVYFNVAKEGTYYVKVAAYDTFEDILSINYGALNWSATKTVVVASSTIVLPASMYDELRTDFFIKDVRMFFGTAPYTDSNKATLYWDGGTTGCIVRGSSIYNLHGTGSIYNANGCYIIATLNHSTNLATLSVASMTNGVPALVSDSSISEIIVAVTSTAPLMPNTNNVCYLRQANSMELEGALIRNLQVTNDLTVNNRILIGDAVLQFLENEVRNSDQTYDALGGTKPPVDADSTSTILADTGTLTLNKALTINSLLNILGNSAGLSIGLSGMADNGSGIFMGRDSNGNVRLKCGTGDVIGGTGKGIAWDGNDFTISGDVNVVSSDSGVPTSTKHKGTIRGNSTGDVYINTTGTNSGWSALWHDKAAAKVFAETILLASATNTMPVPPNKSAPGTLTTEGMGWAAGYAWSVFNSGGTKYVCLSSDEGHTFSDSYYSSLGAVATITGVASGTEDGGTGSTCCLLYGRTGTLITNNQGSYTAWTAYALSTADILCAENNYATRYTWVGAADGKVYCTQTVRTSASWTLQMTAPNGLAVRHIQHGPNGGSTQGYTYVVSATAVKMWNGSAWTDITPASPASAKFSTITVNSATELYLTGSDSSNYLCVWVSKDGGTSWAELFRSCYSVSIDLPIPTSRVFSLNASTLYFYAKIFNNTLTYMFYSLDSGVTWKGVRVGAAPAFTTYEYNNYLKTTYRTSDGSINLPSEGSYALLYRTGRTNSIWDFIIQ